MTATLPYIVLAIFFGRAVTLKGSLDGIIHMFKPQVIKDVARDVMILVKKKPIESQRVFQAYFESRDTQ